MEDMEATQITEAEAEAQAAHDRWVEADEAGARRSDLDDLAAQAEAAERRLSDLVETPFEAYGATLRADHWAEHKAPMD